MSQSFGDVSVALRAGGDGGSVELKGSKAGLPGIPDSQEDVGGWEDCPEIRRPANWYTDRDGIPNRWETEKGLKPDDSADGALDSDGDGYTNLEDYLNWLAAGNKWHRRQANCRAHSILFKYFSSIV
jgi:hypothetical protein